MRILSFLNVSNISNLEADSGYVYQRLLLSNLAKRGHMVSLIGPSQMPYLPADIEPIFLPFSDNRFGVRVGFEWEKLKSCLANSKPCDIALINQSELTLPIKLLLHEIWKKNILCITCFHYLAITEVSENGNIEFDPSLDLLDVGKFLWNRQLESALISDMNVICSQFGKQLFLKGSRSQVKNISMKVIHPPVQNPQQTSTFSGNIFKKIIEKPILLYNHRLYSFYGGCEIFDYLKVLHEEIPFTLVVTDPTYGRSSSRNLLDSSPVSIRKYLDSLPFVEIQHFPTQEIYYQALTQVYIGIGHLRNGALWSMAIADLMSMGKPVVCFNNGAMSEIIGDNDLLFSNIDEFQNIVKKLLLDKSFYLKKSQAVAARSLKLLPHDIADQFHNIFLDINRGGSR